MLVQEEFVTKPEERISEHVCQVSQVMLAETGLGIGSQFFNIYVVAEDFEGQGSILRGCLIFVPLKQS